jgi:hypothetical protein
MNSSWPASYGSGLTVTRKVGTKLGDLFYYGIYFASVDFLVIETLIVSCSCILEYSSCIAPCVDIRLK